VPRNAERSARARSLALYVLLVAAVVLWAVLIWHPWIDWFGRPAGRH
jgi:hypothetical protein